MGSFFFSYWGFPDKCVSHVVSGKGFYGKGFYGKGFYRV